MICFSFIPTVGEITRYGMQAIGILVGVIYGFATVGTMWAALAGIVALGIIGVMGQVVASALGTPMIWGVILIQVIMYALAKEGSHQVLRQLDHLPQGGEGPALAVLLLRAAGRLHRGHRVPLPGAADLLGHRVRHL